MSTTNKAVSNGKTNFTDNNVFNQLDFHIDYRLSQLNTMKICKVVKNYGGNVCDVKPLVAEIDNDGNPVEPPVLSKLPAISVQGGVAGVIIEYKAGDIVFCGFSDRDISLVKKTRNQGAPVTSETTPLSSGVILGALLVQNPNIYVKITDKIYLTGAQVIISDDIEAAKNLTLQGDADINGGVTVGEDAIFLANASVQGILNAASVVPANGASGTFADTGTGASGRTLTITNGIITGIN